MGIFPRPPLSPDSLTPCSICSLSGVILGPEFTVITDLVIRLGDINQRLDFTTFIPDSIVKLYGEIWDKCKKIHPLRN